MTTSWKAVLGIILVFVFGFFSGIVCTSIYGLHQMRNFLNHPGLTLVTAMEKRLTGNLRLDPGQHEQIHAYFLANLMKKQDLQRQIQPGAQAINRETLQQINAVLHPDQLNLFHENIEKLRNKFSKEALDALGSQDWSAEGNPPPPLPPQPPPATPPSDTPPHSNPSK